MPISWFKYAFLSVAWLTFAGCQANQLNVYQSISPYNFEDTLLSLDIAISEYNYRIIHRSDIGQAIRDRGDPNFPLATIISFCNITYAKEMMLIDDHLINEMPCTIAVRETSQGVIVSGRLMQEKGRGEQRNFSTKINGNLRHIIDAATL
ncbi:hypothetical protein Q7C_2211 [Methylophaga frappieri]|uniref:DUF302 domain-containing protein n=1 Tax=Methylophaga frappieri (strain ATCC BAA-2434 / DSM 25690 / JAM7) TaxID=754477 RepID=I1YKA4_METFJ|nr:DUF302 domain-containing protein [Methylophaga frappieri]AFJ03347.1 hypothetical protein Q7C_2211 [Methylophaga frappieri]